MIMAAMSEEQSTFIVDLNSVSGQDLFLVDSLRTFENVLFSGNGTNFTEEMCFLFFLLIFQHSWFFFLPNFLKESSGSEPLQHNSHPVQT